MQETLLEYLERDGGVAEGYRLEEVDGDESEWTVPGPGHPYQGLTTAQLHSRLSLLSVKVQRQGRPRAPHLLLSNVGSGPGLGGQERGDGNGGPLEARAAGSVLVAGRMGG